MSGSNGTNGKNGNGKPPAGPVRCAIYTRKSTTEGLDSDFNTLDAQRESAEHYIRAQAHQNWTILPARYDDGGFTGANIERPALERLMDDIERGAIDLVIVYKVDWTGSVSKTFSGLESAKTQVNATPKKATGAKEGDTVGVYYIGALLNGSVFDSSIKGWKTKDISVNTSFDGADLNPPLEFTVGKGMVIPGFDAAVRGMEVGNEQTVQIPPIAAYGFDHKKHFLGNQTLRFKIKMVSIEPKQ